MSRCNRLIWVSLISFLFWISSIAGAPEVSQRQSSIRFDDQIVEGMNKNSFESLTQISRKDGQKRSRLYEKKQDFQYEINLTIREMGLIQ